MMKPVGDNSIVEVEIDDRIRSSLKEYNDTIDLWGE